MKSKEEEKYSAKHAQTIALRLLARREHSYSELITKLELRGFESQDVVAMMDHLADQGLQSDARFAESFTRYRISRGQGPLRIRGELQQRGVSSELITLALDSEGVDWVELAGAQRCKRFGPDRPKTHAEQARQQRFLHYRGFSSEHIRYCFK
ncbi:MAG: regulatory protein RecX [Gammaproteobacteria bacterium]|nr:regulatory protein RecX [Gammaproteobacteria bacterium]